MNKKLIAAEIEKLAKSIVADMRPNKQKMFTLFAQYGTGDVASRKKVIQELQAVNSRLGEMILYTDDKNVAGAREQELEDKMKKALGSTPFVLEGTTK